ncbi:MAG: bifunctional folylpolyglutamate synthase/dihydrofolate synthase [Chloroflexi bacterium]|nr:bifunctional folylpolyglutamate synthase/dihydrofolate synthase [Chloroflexota bacterium]
MNYTEAMDYILSFTDYERNPDQSLAPIHYDLERVRRLVALLGNPHQRFKSIHVAGTKGKGSTAAMIAGALRRAGLRTGLFSSPHLHSFRERIRISGGLISEEDLCHAVESVRPGVEILTRLHPDLGAPTTFEITTALAFRHFADSDVDVAVLEVGLGGRLDATNVVEPLVSVITSISLDHTQVLGGTIAQIAREKAGIIKPGGTVVSAPQAPEALAVIREVSEDRKARLIVVGEDLKWHPCGDGSSNELSLSGFDGAYERIKVPLLGRHQLANAATAVGALEALARRGIRVSPRDVRAGIGEVRWPGRMEVLSDDPLIVVDGAHNGDSMRKLAAALGAAFPGRRLILIVGTSLDKDISGILGEIVPSAAHTIVTRSDHPRSAPPETIAGLAAPLTKNLSILPDVRAALGAARGVALPGDVICVTGSLFVVAEAREALGLTTV